MNEKGSLVVFKDMEYEVGTGFHKPWLNGAVGVVSHYTKVTNVNDGHVSEICMVKFITPVFSTKGNPITSYGGINVKNLKEIERKPITTKF